MSTLEERRENFDKNREFGRSFNAARIKMKIPVIESNFESGNWKGWWLKWFKNIQNPVHSEKWLRELDETSIVENDYFLFQKNRLVYNLQIYTK